FQERQFLRRKLEHEVSRKPVHIALNGLDEGPRFHSVEIGEIRARHHLLTTNRIDPTFDDFDRQNESFVLSGHSQSSRSLFSCRHCTTVSRHRTTSAKARQARTVKASSHFTLYPSSFILHTLLRQVVL